MTIIDFLRERIEEDEVHAAAAQRRRGPETAPASGLFDGPGQWISINGARLRAECEVKRDLIEWALALEDLRSMGDPHAPEHSLGDEVLRIVAQTYANHPDYDQAWRPDAPRS